MTKNDGKSPNYYLLGAGLGLVVGLVAGHAYQRRAKRLKAQGGSPEPTLSELFSLVTLIIGFINQIANLGTDEDEK